MNRYMVWSYTVGTNTIAGAALAWLHFGSPPAEIAALVEFWWWLMAIILTIFGMFIVCAKKTVVNGTGAPFPAWMKWTFRVSCCWHVPLLIFLGWYYTTCVLMICIVSLGVRSRTVAVQ